MNADKIREAIASTEVLLAAIEALPADCYWDLEDQVQGIHHYLTARLSTVEKLALEERKAAAGKSLMVGSLKSAGKTGGKWVGRNVINVFKTRTIGGAR